MLGAVNDLGCLWDLGLEIVLSLLSELGFWRGDVFCSRW